jgi:hypothetical protein
MVPQQTTHARHPHAFRVAQAALVAAASWFAWYLVWAFGENMQEVAGALGASKSGLPYEFVRSWQWVVAGCSVTMCAVLIVGHRHQRLIAEVWFGTLLVLFAGATVSFGFDWLYLAGMALPAVTLVWLLSVSARVA